MMISLRLKNRNSFRETYRVSLQIIRRVQRGYKSCEVKFVSSCLTRGRTSLLQKDKSKGSVVSNYRPVTCLPLMWKLLAGVITDQIYTHLGQEKLLPEE